MRYGAPKFRPWNRGHHIIQPGRALSGKTKFRGKRLSYGLGPVNARRCPNKSDIVHVKYEILFENGTRARCDAINRFAIIHRCFSRKNPQFCRQSWNRVAARRAVVRGKSRHNFGTSCILRHLQDALSYEDCTVSEVSRAGIEVYRGVRVCYTKVESGCSRKKVINAMRARARK